MPSDPLENEKNELRKFLLDTENMDKLNHYADRPNIFKILSLEHMEIRHSNFLAWLLDPSGNHGLGDFFLKKFLFEYALTGGKAGADVFDIDKMDLDDAIVYRELYHMDIIVLSEQSDFVLVIENKIRASERKGQTPEYRERIEKTYEDVKNRFYVYLTLDQSEPEDSVWVPMSYSQIIPALNSSIKRIPSDSPNRTFIINYTEMIKDMAGNEETELQKLCREIYTRHRRAIDILIENIPDSFQLRADIIKQILNENPNVELRKSNNSYIRFTTPLILEKVGAMGTGDWTAEKDLLLFEIVNNRHGNSRFILSIGPAADPAKREVLYRFLSSKLKNRSQDTGTFSRVYSKPFTIDDNKDQEEQLKKKINEFIDVTIPKELNPVLESFPGFE